MTRQLKNIESLIERASRNQTAKQGAYNAQYFKTKDNQVIFRLFHYGTLTLETRETKHDCWIENLYGESVSDVNSIEYALELVTGLKNRLVISFNPVNGGFYATNHYTNQKFFIDDYSESQFKELTNILWYGNEDTDEELAKWYNKEEAKKKAKETTQETRAIA